MPRTLIEARKLFKSDLAALSSVSDELASIKVEGKAIEELIVLSNKVKKTAENIERQLKNIEVKAFNQSQAQKWKKYFKNHYGY